jgi:hypothetical protein
MSTTTQTTASEAPASVQIDEGFLERLATFVLPHARAGRSNEEAMHLGLADYQVWIERTRALVPQLAEAIAPLVYQAARAPRTMPGKVTNLRKAAKKGPR